MSATEDGSGRGDRLASEALDGGDPPSPETSGRGDGSTTGISGVGGKCLSDAPDLGDLIVVLLASTLAGLRDRLHHDGFEHAADLVADLVEAADDYLTARTV